MFCKIQLKKSSGEWKEKPSFSYRFDMLIETCAACEAFSHLHAHLPIVRDDLYVHVQQLLQSEVYYVATICKASTRENVFTLHSDYSLHFVKAQQDLIGRLRFVDPSLGSVKVHFIFILQHDHVTGPGLRLRHCAAGASLYLVRDLCHPPSISTDQLIILICVLVLPSVSSSVGSS